MARRTDTPVSAPLTVAVFDGTELVGARRTDDVTTTRELLESVRHTGLRALPLSAAAQAVWQARDAHADVA